MPWSLAIERTTSASGHHRDDDCGASRSIGGCVGHIRAQIGDILSRARVTVQDDGRDSDAHGVRRHAMSHRADPQKRHRLGH